MAWWQKKLLRYALSRTGLLDDKAVDLDNLDITLGKKNVIELKDVGLNIGRIIKLAQLPPNLRIETARVLSLRLTVPADIYQSSIVAEVDGVELSLRLEEKNEVSAQDQKGRARSPVTSRIPPHRKVHRRIQSPPPYDSGGFPESDDLRIPTTEELAKSFLLEEPVQQRRELEASVVANDRSLEESTVSESSEGGDLGTGAAIGLPGFLANFLQGIVDRLQVHMRNVEAKLETEVSGDGQQTVPVTLRLHVGSAQLASVASNDADDGYDQDKSQDKRQVKLSDLSLNLVSDAAIFSELSELPSHTSPTESRQRDQGPEATRTFESGQSLPSLARPMSSSARVSGGSVGSVGGQHSSPKSSDAMRASVLTVDADRFADAGEDELQSTTQSTHVDLDIQPGDDNISWGSRRSKSNAPVEDLWNSMTSEDALPESLLLQRVPTSPIHSSGKPSPRVTRERHDVSPYERSFQSPGSWPRLEESLQRGRYQQGPGAWPTIDQSQQSLFQPLTPGPAMPFDDGVDNKRTALQASMVEPEGFQTPPKPSTEITDDLAVSRVFTHEEAESMYLSAMTHSAKMHVPGGWGSEDDQSESSPSSEGAEYPAPELMNKSQRLDDDLTYGEQPYSTPGNVTPRAQSPQLSKSEKRDSREFTSKASRQLLFVDMVSIWVPIANGPLEEQESRTSPVPGPSANLAQHSMPGTFSAYSEMSASRRKPAEFSRQDSRSETLPPRETPRTTAELSPVSIEIGAVKGQLDMPCGRLVYRVISKASMVFGGSTKPESDESGPRNEDSTVISVSIQDVWLAFRDSAVRSINTKSYSEAVENLVTLICRRVDLSSNATRKDVRIGSFRTFIGSSCFLSFDRSRELVASVIVDEQTPDIALVFGYRKGALKRPMPEITVQMLPLNILLDLPAIDEAFDSFGGLSGMLEVGNSILSESGMTVSPSSPTKAVKGVRFEGHAQDNGTELKLNVRMGGICATLRGTTCSVQLRTTTVKAINREYGAVATIEHVVFTGPNLAESETASVSIDLNTLRLDYVLTPQDNDLERLLSLLTPSKDKYDNDDDILLDTLFRQRKKGTVFRASVEKIKSKCDGWEWVTSLSTLGNELSKLSIVAKYLPEDERPGILSLVRIRDLEAHIPVSERFGTLHVAASDVHCAHVGLPALLALSIGNIKASQDDQSELLHPLVQLSGSESLPMLMARMLGDEEDPTIKVKLFNMCIEYSVSVILALSGLNKDVNTEEMVAELARSVANLGISPEDNIARRFSLASDTSHTPSKKMKVDLLIHDSAIGLSPQDMASKGLLVLTDSHFSTVVPPEDTIMAQFNLRKAGLFVADEVVPDGVDTSLTTRGTPGNTSTKPKLTLSLSKQGFVSVGSIMAAKILVRVSESSGTVANTVDMDVRNELLLLETCADSTQTLIAILNGLAPPHPSSKQPKYLTEPMTIEDMMASFTGDAFERPARRPDTLFDVEEEPEDDQDFILNSPTLGDDDDGLLAESEMTESLYGPISGILDQIDEPGDVVDAGEFPETVESLLEDDPFEMAISPTDVKLSDASLLRELNRQGKSAVNDKSTDLSLYELQDLGFDAFGGNQQALGTQFRLDTPATANGKVKRAMRAPDLPFRLRLRDIHIIWNIYDGYDWQRTRDGITLAVEQVEIKAEERKSRRQQPTNEREDDESVIGDFLFNSIYIGVPSSHDAQELRRQINRNIDDLASETESVPLSGMSKPTTAYSSSGRPLHQRQRRRLKLERSKAHKIAFEMKGVSADILVFPDDSADLVSSVDIRVRDFEIFDHVPTSTWRKFLTHMSNEPGAREMSKPMLHIELLNVRTLENFAASEIAMHVSVLPLRLHVDQDALDFITRFFEFKDESTGASSSAGEQPFLQRVEVDTVDLRLDYKPKKVDYVGLRSGHTTEFMNFIILEAANIRLKHAIVYGIKGFEPLHKTLNDIWMPDVKRNQLPTVLAGLAPVRSLVNIGGGVRDVVAIPIREYQKDGRIVRSIQKGAFSFGKTTASELARLGAKVAIGTQTLLKGAEGFLTPTSTSPGRSSTSRRHSTDQGWQDVDSNDEEHESRAISAYANQPLSVFSGLRSARKYLEYDLLTARDALIAVQGEILESSSTASAAAAIAKYAPTVILRPIIGTSRAVGTALLGVGNQIDRGNARRLEDVSEYLHLTSFAY